jgi:hypothetical protein
MAIRQSAALVNAKVLGFGIREALADGRLYEYSGSQPASADVAPTGTLLAIYTVGGNAYTAPVRSTAKITLGGGSGTIDTITVGGLGFNLLSAAVPFNATLTQTAVDVAANINARMNPLNIVATSDGADVILYLPYWLGALGDGLTVAATSTTLTTSINGGSSTAFGGTGSPAVGTTAINGLNFGEVPSTGLISKTSATWQATGLATGTAGWFRYVAGGSTVDGVGGTDVRFDGTIAVSGGDMTVGSTTVEANAVYTINSGSFRDKQTA